MKTSKKLGQHFLIDFKLIEREVEWLDCNGRTVLEIGGGRGNITEELLKYAKMVHVVEKDARLAWFMEKRFENKGNVKIIIGDIRNTVLPECERVIGNIPYYISSEIVFKILRSIMGWEKAILMFQKEFAQRLCAKAGERNYSRLSLMAQMGYGIKLLEMVPQSSFCPPPKVDSAVMEFTRKEKLLDEKEMGDFEEFIRKVFPYRKKKLKSALRHAKIEIRDQSNALLEKRVFQADLDDFLAIWRSTKI